MTTEAASNLADFSRAKLETHARSVADVVARLVPDHVSVLWKGSAQKKWDGPYDFLPGLSDIDIHVYKAGAIEEPWLLRRAVLDEVGPAPWGTPLQLLALNTQTLPDWWLIMSYEVLHGTTPPVATPSTEVLLKRDRVSLAEAHRHVSRIGTDVLGLADDELWGYLRSVRWMFPPTVQRIATVSGHRPEHVWSLNRTSALGLVAEQAETAHLAETAVDYFDAALEACSYRDGPTSELALRAGQRLLTVTGDWAATQPGAIVDRRGTTPPV